MFQILFDHPSARMKTYSHPLEAFPLLMEATDEQRAKYEIGLEGDDIQSIR